MSITYNVENDLSSNEFRAILISSGLAERRPANDMDRLEEMLRKSQIIITARNNGDIVGVARAITDFSYCCYLSDLAVDRNFQGKGIGKRLIKETHKASGEKTSLFLVSSPDAVDYYPKIGMKSYPCWGEPTLISAK